MCDTVELYKACLHVHVVAALLVPGSVVILNQHVDPVMADDVCSTNFGFSL